MAASCAGLNRRTDACPQCTAALGGNRRPECRSGLPRRGKNVHPMPCAGNMPSADQASFLFLERSVNRRSLLTSALLALASRHLPLPAWTQSAAASPMWRHGTSPFGPLKYPAGFARFDYVNPNAPKGGAVRQIALGTFDNFNMAVSGVKGLLVAGVDLTHNSLTTSALDEVSSEYMLIAEAVIYPDDCLIGVVSVARAGEMARRQTDHSGRRHLLVPRPQEIQSASRRRFPAASSKPKNRAIAKSPSPSMGPAIASSRKSLGG